MSFHIYYFQEFLFVLLIAHYYFIIQLFLIITDLRHLDVGFLIVVLLMNHLIDFGIHLVIDSFMKIKLGIQIPCKDLEIH